MDRAPSVVVAGHICLDIIPGQFADPRARAQRPGALDLVGPVALAVGGCVGNTGVALQRLGVRTSLVARIGDDALGRVLADLARAAMPAGTVHLVVVPGQPTSYSVVFNRPGRDRAIAHFPGVNDTFSAGDLPPARLRGADLVHLGYPPLMAALVADGGQELGRLLASARSTGVATSLDMANPNLDPGGGRLRWRPLLERVLPRVDVFVPSLDEACHLLGRRVRRRGGMPDLAAVAGLADELVSMGVAVGGIKLGEHGLLVRTAPVARLASVPLALGPAWPGRELYSTVFEADVVGTTGAGDATIAGFLYALLAGMDPEAAVRAACAVGGSSTEAADGTSGVPSWARVEARLRGGWRRRPADPGAGWSAGASPGSWRGPRDQGPG